MLTVFNNNDYEKLPLAAAPIQPSSEGPELESVGVFPNHLRRDISNRPLAAAYLGRYGLYSLRMRKPRLLTVEFNVSFFVIVITWAEDSMADNSPSPREQPEDECYYRHNIRGNAL